MAKRPDWAMEFTRALNINFILFDMLGSVIHNSEFLLEHNHSSVNITLPVTNSTISPCHIVIIVPTLKIELQLFFVFLFFYRSSMHSLFVLFCFVFCVFRSSKLGLGSNTGLKRTQNSLTSLSFENADG